MRYACFVLAVLALSGCRSLMDPTFMPAGYAYHQDVYKSPPGPPGRDIGYPFSESRNDIVMEKWQETARQLVDDMETTYSVRPQPVYVAPAHDTNAFNTSLDFAVQEELRRRGYQLAHMPGHILTIRHEAFLDEDRQVPVDANRYHAEPEIIATPAHRERARMFTVRLTMLREGVVRGMVEDKFNLPAYGYVRGEGEDRVDAKNYVHTPRSAPPRTAVAEPGAMKIETTTTTGAPPQSLVPAPVTSEDLPPGAK